MRSLVLLCFLLLPGLIPGLVPGLVPGLARADELTITVTVGKATRSFTRSELLARADAATIRVARDVAYRAPMTYRAVPAASLLAGMPLPHDSVIEAVARSTGSSRNCRPTSCSIPMSVRPLLGLQSKLRSTLGRQ